MAKEAALDVLKRGMATELWGKCFYEEAVARTTSEDCRKVFQSLVAEEDKHLDILRGQYAAVSGDGPWISVREAIAMAATASPTGIFPEAASAGQLIPADVTDEQALQMAMEFERRGFELYDAQAKLADSDEAKAMWGALAKAEDKHYAFLQETLEYLASNAKWYFDAREFPFFEG